jgi:hypothetical protein
MLMKLISIGFLAAILFLGNWLRIWNQKKKISPITNCWFFRLLGHLPWAVVHMVIYGVFVAWAIAYHVFGKNTSNLGYFLLGSGLFIAGIPSWWAYKGEGGYLIGRRLIKKESIIEETLLSGKHPILTITFQSGPAKSVIKVRMPADFSGYAG